MIIELLDQYWDIKTKKQSAAAGSFWSEAAKLKRMEEAELIKISNFLFQEAAQVNDYTSWGDYLGSSGSFTFTTIEIEVSTSVEKTDYNVVPKDDIQTVYERVCEYFQTVYGVSDGLANWAMLRREIVLQDLTK